MTRFTNQLIQTALLVSGIFLFSACGDNTGDGIGDIDIAAYMPTHTMAKEYLIVDKNVSGGITEDIKNYDIRVSERNGTRIIKTYAEGDLWVTSITRITDINVTTSTYKPLLLADEISDRHLDIDDLAFKVIFTPCYVDSLISSLEKNGHTYTGDILKIRCQRTDHDTSYTYLMRDIGLIVEIDEDCMAADNRRVESSNIETCPASQTRYHYKFLNM